MQFSNPWLLLLALSPVILFVIYLKRRAWGSLKFSSTDSIRQLKTTWRRRLAHLPAVLRMLGLILLIIALARPQKGTQQIVDASEGIAIEMVIDRSGSMSNEMEFQAEQMTRLDAVKRVFKEFALGNDEDLEGRPNDLIGVITFGTYADTVCPLTLGHGVLPQFLKTIQLPKTREEGQTAIGDGIALAAARLKTAEKTLEKQVGQEKTFTIKSKIMILLTDGEQTAGKRNPIEAAKLAKEWGIKIYTIGVGSDEGVRRVNTFFGSRLIRAPSEVDKETLQAIADETGGKFYMAEDAAALREVYKEIDTLEKSEVKSLRYVNYDEVFHWFLYPGLALLGLELLLSTTLLRRVP